MSIGFWPRRQPDLPYTPFFLAISQWWKLVGRFPASVVAVQRAVPGAATQGGESGTHGTRDTRTHGSHRRTSQPTLTTNPTHKRTYAQVPCAALDRARRATSPEPIEPAEPTEPAVPVKRHRGERFPEHGLLLLARIFHSASPYRLCAMNGGATANDGRLPNPPPCAFRTSSQVPPNPICKLVIMSSPWTRPGTPNRERKTLNKTLNGRLKARARSRTTRGSDLRISLAAVSSISSRPDLVYAPWVIPA